MWDLHFIWGQIAPIDLSKTQHAYLEALKMSFTLADYVHQGILTSGVFGLTVPACLSVVGFTASVYHTVVNIEFFQRLEQDLARATLSLWHPSACTNLA